ncbi:polyketide synthase dehydratase domain-containing protein, partial [Streptomyces sp. SID5910]|uniref:polyketide synthase dehydratase domain-containing protein n=1 Tax=Streptomyces sp. SID5910 TaxID=2690312 RepID=UPI0031FA1458
MSHGWLADHAVAGVALLPGTAFVELALRAGDAVGCGRVEELTLEAPLVLPQDGAVSVQVHVDGPGESGRRTVSVYSQTDGDTWTRHALGTLADDAGDTARADADAGDDVPWPPADAEAVDVEGLYDRFARNGFGYGPTFQGLRAVWRRGEEVFAEVRLPEEQWAEARHLGVHPALLDAALHAMAFGGFVRLPGDVAPGGDTGRVRLPFSWNGVSLHATGASALRVRLAPAGPDAVSVTASDGSGRSVLSVDSLVTRAISREQLSREHGTFHESLFRLDWAPAPAVNGAGRPGRWAVLGDDDTTSLPTALKSAGAGAERFADLSALAESVTAGGSMPDLVFVPFEGQPGTVTDPDTVLSVDARRALSADGVRTVTHRALALAQQWQSDERFTGSRLVFVTRGAVAARAGERVLDPACATVWGLVRAAQSENPDRFVLLDLDDDEASLTALPRILSGDEPQLVVRAGRAFAARLARVQTTPNTAPATETPDTPVWDPQGTVLITGATGVLGSLVARHLVAEHGVRHLLLTSRRGGAAAGAAELADELTASGASVRLAACDVANRSALADLLASVPAEHPLT